MVQNHSRSADAQFTLFFAKNILTDKLFGWKHINITSAILSEIVI